MDTREADLRAPSHPVTATDLHVPPQPPAAVPATRPPPVTPRTLSERIADAERSVIEHDEALRQGVERLRSDARETARRRARTAMTAGAGVLAVGLLWRLTRRRRPHPPAPLAAAPASARRPVHARRALRRSRGSPMLRLLARLVPLSLPMVTPAITARLRQTIGMQATSLVMAVALPAITRAATALAQSEPAQGSPAAVGPVEAGLAAGPSTVPLLDLRRYAGDWYEIARLPTVHESDCSQDVSTHYGFDGRTLTVTNRCIRDDGSEAVITGVAQQPDPALPGRLRVSFAPELLRLLPFTWADYWVLHVDDDYSHAVVGTPELDRLWLLSRSPRADDTAFHRLASLAAAQGYPVHRLIRTPQTGR